VNKSRRGADVRWIARATNAARAGLLIGDAHRGGHISDDAYELLACAVASEIHAVTDRLTH
jgi:hypothetical protein